MATGLAQQATAASDPAFVRRVEVAAVAAALAIYSEATSLAASLQAGVASTSIPLSSGLGAALAAGVVVLVGNEATVVGAAGAAQGATAIPVVFTPARVHPAGEIVSPPTVVGHAARAGLANAVLRAPDRYAPLFAFALAAQSLDGSSTDGAISTALASVWNAMAGA